MAARSYENAAPGARLGSGVNMRSVAARNSEYTATVIDFQTGGAVDLANYRRRWVRRRIPVGPELAAYLANMAFGEGRQ